MWELVACGSHTGQRAQCQLAAGRIVELGRDADLAIVWDPAISRRHATLSVEAGRVRVRRHLSARNPIFFRGAPLDEFLVAAGEQFVIGQTTFQVRSEQAHPTLDIRPPSREHIFAQASLDQFRFVDAEKRMAVLGQVPDLISSAANEADLLNRIANVLLAGIDAAEVAGVATAEPNTPVAVLDWDRRRFAEYPFRPSERLIRRAQTQQETILHLWDGNVADSAITLDPHHQWAMAVPVRGPASQGWTLYVAGRARPSPPSGPLAATVEMQGDVKFAELVGGMLANLRQLQQLERQAASLRPFFSPIVLQAIGGQDPRAVLAPRECELTVMFCDLQGFSRTSERMAANLLGLLQHVSKALSLVTHHLLKEGGVVGDFHGDATMGFWGWPLAEPLAIEKACRAALAIQLEFARWGATLAPGEAFSIGIGIASGRGVAGQIGSDDQVKVTSFGPVVNRAARLESLTRAFRVPVLLDEESAQWLAVHGSGEFRVRPICAVRPVGFTAAVSIAEVLPAWGDLPAPTWEREYLEGFAHFAQGDWDAARKKLEPLRSQSGPADYVCEFLARRGTAPVDWDGVLPLVQK